MLKNILSKLSLVAVAVSLVIGFGGTEAVAGKCIENCKRKGKTVEHCLEKCGKKKERSDQCKTECASNTDPKACKKACKKRLKSESKKKKHTEAGSETPSSDSEAKTPSDSADTSN